MESQPSMTVPEWEARIGDDIRHLRRRKRLTQRELADLANVSPSALKYLEAGKGSSLSTLIRVAKALDRTDWLAAIAPPEPTVSPMAALRAQQRGQKRAPERVRHPTAAGGPSR